MTSHKLSRVRFGIAALASVALIASGPAAAQVQGFSGSGAYREDAGSALSRHLRTLADNPRNQSALMGAGQAALQLGDPQAAITFFARAEEIAPRDGRIKAGIGSAFVQMEQPQSALKFFSDAAALGIPEGEFAGDRGLAHDVTGNPKQAQRDYQLALRHRPDAETERRLALSLAISGDKAGALAAIDAQLRRQDRAGWRTRAFVLALTGDSAGAAEAVQTIMPGQAAALRPFLARLPSLDPASRALAVHFGHFPGDGQTVQMAQNRATAPSYGANQYTPASPPPQMPAPVPSAVGVTPRALPSPRPVDTAVRSRPGAEQQAAASQPSLPTPRPSSRLRTRGRDEVEVLPVRSNNQPQAQSGLAQVPRRVEPAAPPPRPIEFALSAPRATPPPPLAATPAPATPAPATAAPVSPGASAPSAIVPTTSTPGTPAATTPIPSPAPLSSSPPVGSDIQRAELPGSSALLQPAQTPSDVVPAPQPTSPAPAPPTSSAPAAAPSVSGGGLADIAALVNALPSTEPGNKAPPSLPKVAQVDVKTNSQTGTAKAAPRQEKAGPEEAKKKSETAAKEPAKKEPAKPAEPSRHWVQVAGVADRSGLMREFGRLKQKAPKLLGDRTPWTTPLRFTNRLLVGPFRNDDEAQIFVNELSRADISAFSWTSPAGQEISKLSGK